MRRPLVEIIVVAGASALLAAGVFVAGGNLRAVPSPLPTFVTQQSGCLDAPVFALNTSGVTGRGRLCIVDEGVRPAADVEGMTPGMAYSIWFAYFDQPQGCRRRRCAIEDLHGDAASGVAGRMDGIVADGLRKAEFRGDFRDLRLVSGSEVSLLVFERGQVMMGDARGRARQLLTLQLPEPSTPATGKEFDGIRPVAQAIFDLP